MECARKGLDQHARTIYSEVPRGRLCSPTSVESTLFRFGLTGMRARAGRFLNTRNTEIRGWGLSRNASMHSQGFAQRTMWLVGGPESGLLF
jgi:hypothetical protein